MQEIINLYRQLSEEYQTKLQELLPKLKDIIQEECNLLTTKAPLSSILSTVKAIEFYLSDDNELLFDFLSDVELTRNHIEAGELNISEIIPQIQGYPSPLFRLKIYDDELPPSFLSSISLLRTSQVLLPMLFDSPSLIFLISPN